MNLKSTFNWISRILFIICIAISITIILTSYNLYIGYIFYFWLTYLLSYVFVCFTSNKKSIYITLLVGVIPIIIFSYQFFNEGKILEIRKDIENSDYEIIVKRDNYKLIKKIFIFEIIIAYKKSHFFSSNFTKTGIVSLYLVKVKILKENETNITLKISAKNRETIDTIRKYK